MNYAHDKFNVLLPDGSSFDFIVEKVDGSLKFSTSNGRSVKITCNYTLTNIQSFVIIDEKGVKYTFNEGDVYGPSELQHNNLVSWMLSRIDLPVSREPILFNYHKVIENKYGHVESNVHLWDFFFPDQSDYLPAPDNSSPFYSYRMKLLTSIYYNGTSIRFNYIDDTTLPKKNYVNNIQVLDSSTLIKSFEFLTRVKNVSSSAGTVPVALLESVQINGESTDSRPLVYSLQYTSLASTFSGTDYWGYLNQGNSFDGVGNFNLYASWSDSRAHLYGDMGISEARRLPDDQCPMFKVKLAKYSGFNRAPSSTTGHGILSKITYPYGGYTEFEFGNHEFLTSTDQNGDYILNPDEKVPAIAGGFRIEKISNFLEDGTLSDVKTYGYGFTHAEARERGEGNDYHADNYPHVHTGLGEATVDPNIFTFMNFSTHKLEFPFLNLITGRNEEWGPLLLNPCNSVLYPMYLTGYVWRANFSAANFRKLLNGRPPVLYTRVTVYNGVIDEYNGSYPQGKTVYEYNILEPGYDMFNIFRDELFFEESRYIGNVIVTESKQYLYDKIAAQRDYEFNGQDFILVRKIDYKWLSSLKSFDDYIFMNLYPDPYIPNIYIRTLDLFSSMSSHIGTARLDTTTETQYPTPNDSTLTWESFGYNSRDQVTSRITRNSDGKYFKRTWEYPEIKPGNAAPAIIQEMVDRNMISTVLKDSKGMAGSYEGIFHGTPVSSVKIDYKQYAIEGTPYILPHATHLLEIQGSSSKYVLQNEVSSYSLNGNPTEVILKDGLHVSYLWGYKDRYMIARIENATYDQVKQALTMNVQALSSSAIPDMSKVDALRTSLPAARVFTYTREPLRGITSITNPNGSANYFQLDSFGRLQSVSDNNHDLLERYHYHYHHEQ